jgi:hypothetical protein
MARPSGQGEHDHHVRESRSQDRDEDDGEEDGGNRQEHVDDPHQHNLNSTTPIARDHAKYRSDNRREKHGRSRNE